MSPAIRKSGVVLGGFLVFLLSYWLGADYLTPIILTVCSDVPWITAASLSSTIFGFIVAIAYVAPRTASIPRFELTITMALVTITGVIVTWFIGSLGGAVFFGEPSLLFQETNKITQPVHYYLTALLIIGFGPLLEEILYRGYFFEILKEASSETIAMVVSTLLFVIAHADERVPGLALFFIGLHSIVFTFVYIKGGIVASVLTHAFANWYVFQSSMQIEAVKKAISEFY